MQLLLSRMVVLSSGCKECLVYTKKAQLMGNVTSFKGELKLFVRSRFSGAIALNVAHRDTVQPITHKSILRLRHLLYCWIVGGCLLLQISQVECIPKKPQSKGNVTSLFVGAIALDEAPRSVSSNPRIAQYHPFVSASPTIAQDF